MQNDPGITGGWFDVRSQLRGEIRNIWHVDLLEYVSYAYFRVNLGARAVTPLSVRGTTNSMDIGLYPNFITTINEWIGASGSVRATAGVNFNIRQILMVIPGLWSFSPSHIHVVYPDGRIASSQI